MDAAAKGPDPAAPPARRGRLLVLCAVLAGSVYTLDQVTKSLALRHLADRDPVVLLDGLLRLRLVLNPGAAFSLATGLTGLLTLVAVVVVVALVVTARRLGSLGWAMALGLLLAGAMGNLTDRLVRDPGFARGHVVDFVELPRFPVFNLADSAITVGAALVVVMGMRGVGVDGRRPDEQPVDVAAGSDGSRA